MAVSSERDEIRGLVEAMARMLERQATVWGWRTFLLTVADVLGDPAIDDHDALTESRVQIESFYKSASRPVSDFVINRADRAEMIAANEEFERLRREIDVRLARAVGT